MKKHGCISRYSLETLSRVALEKEKALGCALEGPGAAGVRFDPHGSTCQTLVSGQRTGQVSPQSSVGHHNAHTQRSLGQANGAVLYRHMDFGRQGTGRHLCGGGGSGETVAPLTGHCLEICFSLVSSNNESHTYVCEMLDLPVLLVELVVGHYYQVP